MGNNPFMALETVEKMDAGLDQIEAQSIEGFSGEGLRGLQGRGKCKDVQINEKKLMEWDTLLNMVGWLLVRVIQGKLL